MTDRSHIVFVAALALGGAPAIAQGTRTEVEVLFPEDFGEVTDNGIVGEAVAVSGDWAAVSDPAAIGTMGPGGEIYLFQREPSGWRHTQTLGADTLGPKGWALVMDGSTLAFGNIHWDDNRGRVDVYVRVGEEWVEEQVLSPADLDPDENPFFGRSLALEGDVLVVGATGVDQPIEYAGEIRVFERAGGVWSATQRIRLPASEDVLEWRHLGLGAALSLSGNTLAASVLWGFDPVVYIYQHDGNAWNHTHTIDPGRDLAGSDFGWDLALEGDDLLVGRPGVEGSCGCGGAVFAYERAGDGDWLLKRELRPNPPEAAFASYFGSHIALQGDRAFVGAPSESGQSTHRGTVYEYRREEGTWPPKQSRRLVPSEGDIESMGFGGALALSGSTLMVGATGAWHDGERDGGAFYFTTAVGKPRCDDNADRGTLTLAGSVIASDDDLIATLSGAVPGARGLLLFSDDADQGTLLGSDLCLAPPVRRAGLFVVGDGGAAIRDLDLLAPPFAGHVVAGSTWHFQALVEGSPGTRVLDTPTNSVSLALQ